MGPRSLCRAGDSARQASSTRPHPILRPANQPRPNRILFNIGLKFPNLAGFPQVVIERIPLPKLAPSAPKDPIRPACSRPLQPSHRVPHRLQRQYQHVRMIGHQHPSMKLIKPPLALPGQNRVSDQISNTRIVQPRPGAGEATSSAAQALKTGRRNRLPYNTVPRSPQKSPVM